MSQFSVYKNENKSSNKSYPYFVDIQTELLDTLNTRLVIPLSTQKDLNGNIAQKLCPIVNINNKPYVLLTHLLTSVPIATLQMEVDSIESYRTEIISAIDLVITGI